MPRCADAPRSPPARAILAWEVSACERIEFVQATLGRCGLAAHFHDVWSIGLILRGSCHFTSGGVDHLAPAGSVFILPPYEVHACRAADAETAYAVLYVEAEAMSALAQRLAAQVTAEPRQRVWLPTTPLQALFSQAIALRDTTAARCWLAALEQALAGPATPAASSPNTRAIGHKTPALHPLQALLHQHWAEPIDLRALEASLPRSRWHSIRTFRQATGLTPGAYLRQLRVQKSRRQLAAAASLADLAAALGFADQAHFTRAFKQVYGVTPGRLRGLRRPGPGPCQVLTPTTASAPTAAAPRPSAG